MNLIKRLGFLLFLLFHFSLHSQERADSLLQILPELTGNAKAEIYIQLSSSYCETDSSLALNYANDALEIGNNTQNSEITGKAYISIADTYYSHEEYGLAIVYYQKAKELLKNSEDFNLLGELHRSCGLSHFFHGENDEALSDFLTALSFFEETGNKILTVRTYSNIAQLYSDVSKFDKSLEYYRKALTISIQENIEESIPVYLNGIGVIHYMTAELDSAKYYYELSLEQFKEQNNELRTAALLNNIASIYVDEGNYSAGLEYYNDALDVFKNINNKRYTSHVLQGIGDAYLAMGEYKQAISTFDEGLEIANSLEHAYYLQTLFYEDLSKAYEELGDIEEALESYKSFKFYTDSLLADEQVTRIEELEAFYQTEKKEAEINRLNAENELANITIQKNKVIRTYGISAIIFLIIIVGITSWGYFLIKRTNNLLSRKNDQIEKQKIELEELNASKNKFFSIFAHDLKNPFHTVLGYSYILEKEYDRFSNEDRKKYAGDIHKSTNSIFRLLQNLLVWSRSQTGRIKYDPVSFDFLKVYERVESLLKTPAQDKNIQLISQVDENTIVFADPSMIETVLRNLIYNAIKFSFEESKIITSISKKNDSVTVSVKDQGIGISENDIKNLFRIDSKVKHKGTNDESGSGLGLILCHEFVKNNKGEIWVESDLNKGSTFYFTIPTHEKA